MAKQVSVTVTYRAPDTVVSDALAAAILRAVTSSLYAIDCASEPAIAVSISDPRPQRKPLDTD